MLLQDLFDYKTKLMELLCNNERIVHLVTNSKNAPTPNYDLRYTQIFPYEYLPETVDDARTYICFDVDVPSVMNQTYYLGAIHIWIFTHKSLARIKGGGVRNDEIAMEIDAMLNGSREFGLGELDLHKSGRFSPIPNYQGRSLTYQCEEFNRVGVKKSVPANRKLL